ncbi:MAG: 50S ribosomal protein L29 [Bdellovibrionaceae bacterium]|nr:50S ribosomal protein L29 [Pseudobdellovibrionaceae bacterium]
MKASEFKGMSKDELKNNLRKKTEELYELKVKNKLGQLANPLTIRLLKKDIARVLTVINATKGQSAEVTKPAKTAKAKKAPKVVAKVTKAKKVTKAGASRARK